MAQRHALSFFIPPILIYASYLIWRNLQSTSDAPDVMHVDETSAPLVRVDFTLSILNNHPLISFVN